MSMVDELTIRVQVLKEVIIDPHNNSSLFLEAGQAVLGCLESI